MNATFSHKTQLSPTVWEFYVKPDAPLDYQAGQYVDIRLRDTHDARGSSRVFTLTSLPGDELLSFAVKFPNPCTNYKQALLNLEPGEVISVSQAMGDLVLPRDKARPLVFVAGGLGIASFASMCKALAAKHEQRTITLLYAMRDADNELFVDTTTACPGLAKTLYVSPNRIDASQIAAAGKDGCLYYLSGSEPFTMGLRADLLKLGIPATNIVYDFFDGYSPADL